jgi:hypothetical protein
MRHWLLLVLVPVLSACSSRGGTVRLVPLDGSRAYVQEFGQAYVARPAAGEYDIVLLDSPAENAYRWPKKKRPLEPIPIEPLQQVLHIHLYWQPMLGVEKNPAAVNASINWYVLGADGAQDLIVYEGAGLVALDGEHLSIRDGELAPGRRRGSLGDPVGAARISGDAIVRLNSAQVQDTLEQMRQQAGAETSARK